MEMALYLGVLMKNPEFFGIYRYCNICGFRFSKFALFNKLRPREAMCPVCGSLERHRHLYVHLLSIYPFLKNKKILHFAPEQIIKDIFLNSNAEYFDADLNPQRARYTVDITDIPFDDNSFDYIICIHVLEHIVDDIKAMSELYRVLKKGGTAFLAVPVFKELIEDYTITTPKEREEKFGQDDHVRGYSFDVFLERLNAVGFDTEFVSDPSLFPQNMQAAKLGNKIVCARKK